MKLFALIALGTLCLAQERVQPAKMAQLKMLVGEWKAVGKGGKVEFFYDMTAGMIGRAKPDGASAWRRMMLIHPDGSEVRADFYDTKGRVTHYRLDVANGHTLSFVEDPASGSAQRRIIYEKVDPDHLSYHFETGNRVIDSGTLAMIAEVRPLSE